MALHALSCLLALALMGAAAPHAQQAATTPSPVLTDAAVEEFLREARVVEAREIGKGVTGSVRATLSDGTLTHDAHIQTVDVAKAEFRGKGVVERNFRDNWRFNVAAYEIDRLLGLNLVPVSVPRRWKGDPGAFTWWVDDVMMDEGERLKKNLTAPDAGCWEQHANLVRMFDRLIDNADRNLGNLLITNTWRMWAIDHTRAFRYSRTPRTVATLTGIDRQVLKRLEGLDFEAVKDAVDGHISDSDIRNLLARRDGIVAHFKQRGESALYDRRNPAEGCLKQVDRSAAEQHLAKFHQAADHEHDRHADQQNAERDHQPDERELPDVREQLECVVAGGLGGHGRNRRSIAGLRTVAARGISAC